MGFLSYRRFKAGGRDNQENSHKEEDRQATFRLVHFNHFINIKDNTDCSKISVSFDTKNVLDANIDKLITLISKYSSQNTKPVKALSSKYIKVKGEDMKGTIIMTEKGSRRETGYTVQIGFEGHHIEGNHSLDQILGKNTLEVERKDFSGITMDLIEVREHQGTAVFCCFVVYMDENTSK